MSHTRHDSDRYPLAIGSSHKSIYDPIEIDDPNLWIPTPDLEALLDTRLRGISLAGLPLRTRSKVVKVEVCKALGYPVPPSFIKTQPRFPGQMFDTYVQKSNNLQVWNEEISPIRRYAIIKVSETDVIERVKVVTGDVLASLDKTGTLTRKYQARVLCGDSRTELISASDTIILAGLTSPSTSFSGSSPVLPPRVGEILPISVIYERLSALVGTVFPDRGRDQERNRGADLHRLACQALGYSNYQDDGRFPDILHQLVEVKLQTSPTIDLGLVCPDSTEALDIPKINGHRIRHCDVRYAVFYAVTDGITVRITNLLLSTGTDFFNRFPKFQGKVLNAKIQVPLPREFFL